MLIYTVWLMQVDSSTSRFIIVDLPSSIPFTAEASPPGLLDNPLLANEGKIWQSKAIAIAHIPIKDI